MERSSFTLERDSVCCFLDVVPFLQLLSRLGIPLLMEYGRPSPQARGNFLSVNPLLISM